MPKTSAIHHQRSILAGCLLLLAALVEAGAGNGLAAATFGATDTGAAAPLDDNTLEALAAPVALYPDELLAIVLPAATVPLQIVQAARFLEARRSDPALEPDDAWDDSVVALLNYPEVLALLDSDLAWTARLGDAVIAREASLMQAIARFRERAYNAGNLRSDERQHVNRDAGAIAINSASTDSVYVPYYQPSAVIVPQATRVYHYYSNPYPLYYYPYAPRHPYLSRPFWGLTTAYVLGWATHGIRIYRHDHYGHPYFRRPYYGSRYRHRRPAWPRHAPLARHDYRRHADGEAWHRGKTDGRHGERDRRPGDRIRNSHASRRSGAGNALRASNGLLGNGATARAQTRELRRADRGIGADAGSPRRAVTVKPPATFRQQGIASRAAPLQQRARENGVRRDPTPRREATTNSRRPQTDTRRGGAANGERRIARGTSSRANPRPGTDTGFGRAFRDYGGGNRARAGGAFLGNGFGRRQR